MTLTIELQPEVERSLLAQAQAKGVSLAEYVEDVVEREARSAEAKPEATAMEAKNLYDLLAPVRGLLTDDEADTLFARNRSGPVRSTLNERFSRRHERYLGDSQAVIRSER